MGMGDQKALFIVAEKRDLAYDFVVKDTQQKWCNSYVQNPYESIHIQMALDDRQPNDLLKTT